ncbi:MAG: hypothetical protein GY830_01350 [Bacteroidetes bacterium]|nr:hypothetical protein [Bacteroidota bacterium]
MNNLTVITIFFFLLTTLIVGLYASRNIKDIKEYTLGNKKFSPSILTLTLLATYIGGGATIGTVGEIYRYGIIIIIAYLGKIIRHLIFAKFISPHIENFEDCLTIGDLMHKLYGRNIKILTGVLTLFYSLFLTTVQIFMIGKVLNSFLNIKTHYCIIISGLLLSVYSASGGIKAVTFTDVLQFIVLIIGIPFLGTLALKKVGGYEKLLCNISSSKFMALLI